MRGKMNEIYNKYLKIADSLDIIDETLAEVEYAELKEKGLELVHTAGQFSKELHELIVRYDPVFNEYEGECLKPYEFPKLRNVG